MCIFITGPISKTNIPSFEVMVTEFIISEVASDMDIKNLVAFLSVSMSFGLALISSLVLLTTNGIAKAIYAAHVSGNHHSCDYMKIRGTLCL